MKILNDFKYVYLTKEKGVFTLLKQEIQANNSDIFIMWIKYQISRFITIIKCFTFFHHDRIKVHKSIRRVYDFHWFEYPKTVNSVAMYSNPKITPNYTTLLLCWLNNIVQDTLLSNSLVLWLDKEHATNTVLLNY